MAARSFLALSVCGVASALHTTHIFLRDNMPPIGGLVGAAAGSAVGELVDGTPGQVIGALGGYAAGHAGQDILDPRENLTEKFMDTPAGIAGALAAASMGAQADGVPGAVLGGLGGYAAGTATQGLINSNANVTNSSPVEKIAGAAASVAGAAAGEAVGKASGPAAAVMGALNGYAAGSAASAALQGDMAAKEELEGVLGALLGAAVGKASHGKEGAMLGALTGYAQGSAAKGILENSSLQMPNISFPNISMPSIEFPSISFPNISFPNMSDFNFSEFNFSEFISNINFSKADFPKINFSNISFPKINFSNISFPKINFSKIEKIDANKVLTSLNSEMAGMNATEFIKKKLEEDPLNTASALSGAILGLNDGVAGAALGAMNGWTAAHAGKALFEGNLTDKDPVGLAGAMAAGKVGAAADGLPGALIGALGGYTTGTVADQQMKADMITANAMKPNKKP